MIIGQVMGVGDRVSLQVLRDNREWGFNPGPDGMEGSIVSFGEIPYGYVQNFGHEPGVYENRCWMKVNWDGQGMAPDFISEHHLAPVDTEDYNRKVSAYRDRCHTSNGDPMPRQRLRDLPDTKFWPGDVIECSSRSEVRFISNVRYERLEMKRTDGSPMPIFDVSPSFLPVGWTTWADEESLTLVERGKVWNFHHNIPNVFDSLRQEAMLAWALGRTREVRNPVNGLFLWTKDEAIGAIRDRLGHAISVGRLPMTMTDRKSVDLIRFLDEDLGKRVAAETLAGFSS